MPEMPEVETIKRILEPQIIGQSIRSVTINHSQVIAHPEMYQFETKLVHQVVHHMSRRGKYLMIHFEEGSYLVVHLKMTGQLLVTPPDYPMEKHTHLILNLSDGNQIRYIDVRRFGRFWYFDEQEQDLITGIDQLGAEPLGTIVNGDYLSSRLGNRKRSIKEMLHDQSIVAGIGNIYSDEILFAAGINPGRSCSDLNFSEWDCLAQKIKEIINWGIDTNKMTAQEYLDGKGKEYRNMDGLKVYGREGSLCNQCGSIIEKTIIGGRSSCHCPQCQK